MRVDDSHCHLDYFAPEEAGDVVARARAAGVGAIVTIGVRVSQAARVKELADSLPDVWGTVGVHPHNAHEGPTPEVADLVALADHPRVVGIGESGLDHHYDTGPRDAQEESFRRHVRAAQATGLPLVVHAREADADIARVLREEREAGGPFVALLHCYTGGRALAEEVVAHGGYVSFSGILTFPRSDALRDLAASLPMGRLLVETDAPYLAPVPHRGRRNEPAYVVRTAEALARARGETPGAVAEATGENLRRLFRRMA